MSTIDRTEQAARHMMTLATVQFASDPYAQALNSLEAMRLTENETKAAALMGREWFALASRIAAAMDQQAAQ